MVSVEGISYVLLRVWVRQSESSNTVSVFLLSMIGTNGTLHSPVCVHLYSRITAASSILIVLLL